MQFVRTLSASVALYGLLEYLYVHNVMQFQFYSLEHGQLRSQCGTKMYGQICANALSHDETITTSTTYKLQNITGNKIS